MVAAVVFMILVLKIWVVWYSQAEKPCKVKGE